MATATYFQTYHLDNNFNPAFTMQQHTGPMFTGTTKTKVKKEKNSFQRFRQAMEDYDGSARQILIRCDGDLDQREDFRDILRVAAENGLIPVFMTSAVGMTPEIAEYCKLHEAKVIFRWDPTKPAMLGIRALLDAKVHTEVYFKLTSENLQEATDRLNGSDFPSGVTRVTFEMPDKVLGRKLAEGLHEILTPNMNEFFFQMRKEHPFEVLVV